VEAPSKLGEEKSKSAGKELQSKVKENPNIFFPPIEAFQRLKRQIQGKATLAIAAGPIYKIPKSNNTRRRCVSFAGQRSRLRRQQKQ
jgi:hypothetical protein